MQLILIIYHKNSYPELSTVHVVQAHPANCICIEFDPTGKYFATGSADALVSLWDADEIACLRTFSRSFFYYMENNEARNLLFWTFYI